MQHHDTAVDRYVQSVRGRSDVIGVLVTGSVSRGAERVNSDIDLVLLVTQDAWARAVAEDRVMFVQTDGADYPGGYFDIKLMTSAMLDAAVLHGDDPVRSSLADGR